MSLQEPTKKMSKSDENEQSYIGLLDHPDEIRKKMQRAVTDSGKEICTHPDKPGVSNLLTLYSVITNQSIETLETKYLNQGYGQFKKDIAENLIEFLAPIQERYHQLRRDLPAMHKILDHGAHLANKKSKETLERVHDLIGFIPKSFKQEAKSPVENNLIKG